METIDKQKNTVNITESELHDIIKESVSALLLNEDFVKYTKYRSPYDDKKEGNGQTQPLKQNISLYDIRPRLANVLHALKNNKIDDAQKQVWRLYKLVDAMINQGF